MPRVAYSHMLSEPEYQVSIKRSFAIQSFVLAIIVALLLPLGVFGATVSSRQYTKAHARKVTERRIAKKRVVKARHVVVRRRVKTVHTRTVVRRTVVKKRTVVRRAPVRTVRARYVRRPRIRRRRYYQTWTTSSYSEDQTAGDITAGEDPVVRQAAIEALGDMNGAVVVIDPETGRILAMVNQKLALAGGAIPCSTIKLSVALAGLSEGIVTKDTKINIGHGVRLDMTQALAHSNNLYFEALGRKLGFERVAHYAHEFGLGELAGWGIAGEHLGTYPSHEIPAAEGGVGRMCSFGQGVNMTPLQLGALMSAIANGGTLYYLQHPTTLQQEDDFQPKVKRYLNIAQYVPEIMPGIAGAVDYGTARLLRQSFTDEEVVGKTGTCSEGGTRLGWFVSFANTQRGRVVAVFMLQGGRPTYGPRAAALAGKFYRSLWDHNFFARTGPLTPTPVADAATGLDSGESR